jgi:hypothetical protein
MKIYTNQRNIHEGRTAVVEHKDKDQAAGLEVAGVDKPYSLIARFGRGNLAIKAGGGQLGMHLWK